MRMLLYRNAYTSGILLCLLILIVTPVGIPAASGSTKIGWHVRKMAPVRVDGSHLFGANSSRAPSTLRGCVKRAALALGHYSWATFSGTSEGFVSRTPSLFLI